MKFDRVTELRSLSDTFLLEKDEVNCTERCEMKVLTVSFEGTDWKQELQTYHTACTETTPYQYFGLGFNVAKNYHTLKWYSKDGEADLEGEIKHLLKYYLPDGSYIFIRSDFTTHQFHMLIRAVDEDKNVVQSKLAEMEETLLLFLSTL